MNYRALVKGTNTGNKTGVQCSSGKVIGALNHTLIEKGQNFALNNTLINKGEAVGPCISAHARRDSDRHILGFIMGLWGASFF